MTEDNYVKCFWCGKKIVDWLIEEHTIIAHNKTYTQELKGGIIQDGGKEI